MSAVPDTTDEPVLECRTALPLGVHAVAEARRLVTTHLPGWGLHGDVTDAVTLVVSELVTNAVLYGHGAGTLVVRLRAGLVDVEVSDRSTALPQRRTQHDDAEIGRGLPIIDACSVEWGVRPTEDGTTGEAGKVVWATLAATSVPAVARDLVQERL